jgi:hypothetical protein
VKNILNRKRVGTYSEAMEKKRFASRILRRKDPIIKVTVKIIIQTKFASPKRSQRYLRKKKGKRNRH